MDENRRPLGSAGLQILTGGDIVLFLLRRFIIEKYLERRNLFCVVRPDIVRHKRTE
jgi:hypothetical protein